MPLFRTIKCILIFISFVTIGFAQNEIQEEQKEFTSKKELRGVFLTTIFNFDWPTNKLATPDVQQNELLTVFDDLVKSGYNTVFLQVRPEGDAFYSSEIEPWSYRLTGAQGKTPVPFWDPLAFAVAEAHKRGLDLHAWLNPFRASANAKAYVLAKNHVINTHPNWIISASNDAKLKILNPGLPEVQDYITSVVVDIATRYDVDGIHFDDYFYPHLGMATNQDKQTYLDFNPTNIANIADWRRSNVNTTIAKVYDALQEVNTNFNKNVVFGVSPIGIWKSGFPFGIKGNSSYSALFCDPIAWLQAGKVDYLAPQLYWKIKGPQDYISLSQWWNDQVKLHKKQLYVSQSLYRTADASNWTVDEIQNQINQNRSLEMTATFGQIAYRYGTIKNNKKNSTSILKVTHFFNKAFAPPIVAKDSVLPNPPVQVRLETNGLKWEIPNSALDGDFPKKYVVYAFNDPFEIENCKNDNTKIIDILANTKMELSNDVLQAKCFVVTSLDKNNNESTNFSSFICATSIVTSKAFELNLEPFVYDDNPIDVSVLTNNFEIDWYDNFGNLVVTQECKAKKKSNKIVIEVNLLSKNDYFGKIRFNNRVVKVVQLSRT